VRDNFQRTVIVAMVAVGMVQMSIDQVVGMVAMRHGFVSAAWAVPMRRIMSAAAVVRRAAVGIRRAHFDDVLIDVILVRVMEMAVVKVIDVTLMADRDMTAARLVDMRMVGVNRVIVRSHGLSFLGSMKMFATRLLCVGPCSDVAERILDGRCRLATPALRRVNATRDRRHSSPD
jgi:hypothetical protein